MANTTTKATLGGYPLKNTRKVEWKLIDGTRPNMEIFSMIPAHAELLLRTNDKPVSLVIEPTRNRPKVQIDYLYVLREAPSENTKTTNVLVADRRWMWDHNYIERDYNIRRNVGNLRTHSGDQRQLDITSPETRYWPWSLHEPVNGAAGTWLPSESIEDVLKEVLETEKKQFGVTPKFTVFASGKGAIDRTPWEGVSLRDGGATALARLLAQLPATAIKVELNGDVAVYLKSLRKSGDTPDSPQSLRALGVPISGFGVVAHCNNRLIRPRRIVVKFEREVETMFESVIEQSRNQTVAQPGDDQRYMVNVGQVTEPFLNKGSFTDAQGTWLAFDSVKGSPGLIDRWPNADGGFRIDQEFIRRALLPMAMELWGSVITASEKNVDVDWAGRIAMLERCYRRTYRINDKWMSRIRSMRPYRVSIVNQAFGTLAPAAVFGDYAILPSKRGKMGLNPRDQFVYKNVNGFGAANPSPAHVKILDEDQGIILIDYEPDPLGLTKSIVPSLVDNMPNADISNVAYGACTADGLPEGGKDWPAMAPGHRVKIIITCVPASPNNDQKLQQITVLPSQAEDVLGYKLGECVGPEMEIYVGPNVCTCKVKWDDSRVGDIQRCFGIGNGPPNLTGLILNEGTSTPGTGAELNTVALAHAVAVYGSLVDRVEGSQAGMMNPNVKLEGWAASVAHSLSQQGHVRTIINYPDQIPKLSISGFLDANTRNALYKLAQPSSVV